MTTRDLSIIVICRNNSDVLEQTYGELTGVLSTLGMDTEVIYVDNGSIDDTAFRLKHLIQQPASIPCRLVVLRRDFGLTSAFVAGVAFSEGRFVLTIDPLLTVDPVEIMRLVEEIEHGYDLVSGWRNREHLSAFVHYRSRMINAITSRVTGLYLHDYGTPCRIVRREILDDMRLYGEMFAFMPVFARFSGAQIVEIPVTYRPDYYVGKEYSLSSLVGGVLDLITVWFLTRYSTRPMHLFGNLGLLFILTSIAFLLIAIVIRIGTGLSLIQTPLPTLSGILLVIGILTMLLGLTTEVVIRSYFEAQNRATYSVREICESARPTDS